MTLARVGVNFILDSHDPEDSIQDFDHILGFPCKGVVHAWEWRRQGKGSDAKESDAQGKNGKGTEAFLGNAPAFLEVLRMAEKLKGSKAPVLITGESGTGKELLAHFIHQLEGDAARPFVAVNCGAILENLMESEFFGHEKGAFTGAVDKKIGLFEQADGGDIFLDEISALKPEMQVKLLRVLQEKKIRRVGGREMIPVDFRVIAASNEDLGAWVEVGRFRLDLFHRLSVIPLKMPALRDRVEDIPLLVEYFVKKYKQARSAVTLDDSAMEWLTRYPWPGNIRQLENVIHRMVVLFPDSIITAEEIAGALQGMAVNGNGHGFKNGNGDGDANGRGAEEDSTLRDCVEELEKEKIRTALQKNRWNIHQTSRDLRISRTTLYKKITAYQLSRH